MRNAKGQFVRGSEVIPHKINCTCSRCISQAPPSAFKKGNIPWNKGKKLPKLSGSKSSRWKGGKIIRGGYRLIRKPNHPNCIMGGYIAEHRFVMEKHLGRYLTKEECVHHLDEDKLNNNIKNLKLCSSHGKHSINNHPLERDPKTGQFINILNY